VLDGQIRNFIIECSILKYCWTDILLQSFRIVATVEFWVKKFPFWQAHY